MLSDLLLVLSSVDNEIYLIIGIIGIPLLVNSKLKRTVAKYSKISCNVKISGQDAANILLAKSNINNVEAKLVDGVMSDYYDPGKKIIGLSKQVFDENSISSIGVAAHEVGHAIQDAIGYGPLMLRNVVGLIAGVGSLGPYLVIGGLVFSFPLLVNIGIFLYIFAVLFSIITLPSEFDASVRAVKILDEHKLLTKRELAGAKKVLDAAALTYVAATITSLLDLIHLIIISSNDD